MYLKDKCSCGGKIAIVTYSENGKTFVSHGVCSECLKNIVLPQEEMKEFLKKDV